MNGSTWFGRIAQDAAPAAVSATGLLHKSWIQDATAPLVLMVHGRAGSRDSMWAFCHALPTSVNLLLPEAFLEDPDDGGHSWWLKGGMNPDAVQCAADRLDLFYRAAVENYSLQPRQVLAFGFSQGSAVLSVSMQDFPQRFAGVAILAGFVIDRAPQMSPPQTKVLIAHGTRDAVIPLPLAKSGADSLVSKGYSVEFHTDDVEHKVGKTGMRALKEWSKKLLESA